MGELTLLLLLLLLLVEYRSYSDSGRTSLEQYASTSHVHTPRVGPVVRHHIPSPHTATLLSREPRCDCTTLIFHFPATSNSILSLFLSLSLSLSLTAINSSHCRPSLRFRRRPLFPPLSHCLCHASEAALRLRLLPPRCSLSGRHHSQLPNSPQPPTTASSTRRHPSCSLHHTSQQR